MKNICNNCIFKDRKKVEYEGAIPCDIMLVGEAPAETELLLERPFVGDSGKILRGILALTELNKKRILIANALKCPVYKDQDSTKEINEAMRNCKEHLIEAINKAKPKIIVCLGGYAIKQITGQTKVLDNRGKVYDYNGIPVFCTVHPSYILRGGAQKGYPYIPYTRMNPREKMLVDDFIQLKKMVDNGYKKVDIDTTNYKEATIEELTELLKEKRLAVDIETNGLGYGNNIEVLSISFTRKTGESLVVLNLKDSKTRNIVSKILSNPKIIKVVANRPFDEIMCRRKLGIEWRGVIHDVLVLAHLIDENLPEGYNLESIVHNYTELKNIKEMAEGLRKDISSMSKETLIRYNGVDTDGTFRAYEVIIKELKKDKKLCNYYKNFMLPVLNMYSIISEFGFPIDREELAKSREELTKIADDIHKKAIEKIHYVIRMIHKDKGLKLSRSDLIVDVLFKSKFGYRLKPKKFTGKTKKPSTDEGHLKEFAGNEFVDLLLRWKKAYKLITTYYKNIEESINDDGKIYPSTLFYQTVTGRTVVLNPTIQTIPQRGEFAPYVKRVFKAPDGWVLCARDLAQSELRIIGWLANDKNILDALAKGIDLHTKTAAIVNKCSINEVTKDMRQKAKPVNFGFVYGMMAKSFVRYAKEEYGQIFTLEEAEQIRRDFFSKPNGYYKLPIYHQQMISMAKKHGYVRSPLGRKRRLPNIHSEDGRLRAEAERQAINFPVQSFSSDLALIGKMLFTKELIREHLLGSTVIPLWFIHDAVMFLVKKGFEEEAHQMLKRIYLEDVPTYIEEKFGVKITYPVESDGKVGPSWADMEDLNW